MIQVNQTTITENTILAEMQYHPADSQRNAMMQAAESLIISELLRQRATQLGLSVSHDDDHASNTDFIELLLEREIKISNFSERRARHKAIAQYIQQLINEADIKGYDFNLPSSAPLMQ
jgi:peptidyl-prolyl cis-trans isomerase C